MHLRLQSRYRPASFKQTGDSMIDYGAVKSIEDDFKCSPIDLEFCGLDRKDKSIKFTWFNPADDREYYVTFGAEELQQYIERVKAQDPQADVAELQKGLDIHRNFFAGPLSKAKQIVFDGYEEKASTESLLALEPTNRFYEQSGRSNYIMMKDPERNNFVRLSAVELRDTVAAAREEGYELPHFQQAINMMERMAPPSLPVKFGIIAASFGLGVVVASNAIGAGIFALDEYYKEKAYQPEKLAADPASPQALVQLERREVLSGPLPQKMGESIEVVNLDGQTVTRITYRGGGIPLASATSPAWLQVCCGLVNKTIYADQTQESAPESLPKVAAAAASFNRVAGNGGSTDAAELHQAMLADWRARLAEQKARDTVARLMPR